MKRLLILAFLFIIPLAGCQTNSDEYGFTAAQSPLEKGMISKAASAMEKDEPEEGENPGVPSRLDQALELQSGIYGIPFGATTDELMKWCTDNRMAIGNLTEEDVKKDVKQAIGRIRNLERQYDFEMAFLTPLEKELLGLAQGYAETGDVFELAKVTAAQEKLEILKNPTISYKGKTCYLSNVHKGMKVKLDGEEKTCTDERITKTIYVIGLTPTDESEKMVRNGLELLLVFLYGDVGQEPRTYATIAILGSNPERSASLQYELVVNGISQRYGPPAIEPLNLVDGPFRDEIDHLLGREIAGAVVSGGKPVVWARNLLLSGDRPDYNPMDLNPGDGTFGLLYYDHKVAKHIIELHLQALEDFEKEYHQKKKDALAQIQKDF